MYQGIEFRNRFDTKIRNLRLPKEINGFLILIVSSRSSMDRALASEAEDLGSNPNESARELFYKNLK